MGDQEEVSFLCLLLLISLADFSFRLHIVSLLQYNLLHHGEARYIMEFSGHSTSRAIQWSLKSLSYHLRKDNHDSHYALYQNFLIKCLIISQILAYSTISILKENNKSKWDTCDNNFCQSPINFLQNRNIDYKNPHSQTIWNKWK